METKKQKQNRSLFNILASTQEAEPGRGKNLVVVAAVGGCRRQLHTPQFTEALLHHTIQNKTAAPLCCTLITAGICRLIVVQLAQQLIEGMHADELEDSLTASLDL